MGKLEKLLENEAARNFYKKYCVDYFRKVRGRKMRRDKAERVVESWIKGMKGFLKSPEVVP